MSTNESAPIIFIRGNQRFSIDYIFLSQNLTLFRTTSQVTYITPVWTDHLLIQVRLHLLPKITVDSTKKVDKGLWRAHPKLVSDPAFCYRLHVALSQIIAGSISGYPTYLKWEDLKAVTKYIAVLFTKESLHTCSCQKTASFETYWIIISTYPFPGSYQSYSAVTSGG
jgi:hypothetical protein